ncbi:MAG: SLBB domain-containing protein [candidate division KSB1 bacterium]|nr:SLBB domain-containing protein [candidate division KSB1 bacterium]
MLLSGIILLALFSAGQTQERVIKPGDMLNIVVYGHNELSRQVTVGPNGSIDYPFMQNIPVDGMTLEELRRFLSAQLARYVEGQPIITISFTASQLVTISVLGYVKKPGTIQLPLSGTLQEAIALAGGPMEGAKMDQVTVIRNENGEVKRRNYNLVFLNLLGDMRQNPVMQQGDVVLVTGNPIFSGVKVLGEVNDPGIHEAVYGATVMDMIFKAGGLKPKADLRNIRYISPSEKTSREVKIDLEQYYSDPYHYSLPTVSAGDLIIVPTKKETLQTIRSVLQVAANLSSLASMFYYITLINRYRK